jgi:signal peptidase complex subunit 2
LVQLSVSTKTKKHDPTYYITVATSNTPKPQELSIPFTTWFTEDGYFVPQTFQQWLATNVDVIGEADSKNASKREKADLNSSTVLNGTTSASGADGGAGKGSKRNKRKG